MKEQVEQFLQALDRDTAMKKRFTEARDSAELETLIKEAGFSFSAAEYRHAVKELRREAGIEQITDEKLDRVAGGFCSPICSPVNICDPTDPHCSPRCDPHCKPHWRECDPQCSPDCNPK